jgi:hypothetical protein
MNWSLYVARVLRKSLSKSATGFVYDATEGCIISPDVHALAIMISAER